jgi:hypothetical protein
VDETVDTAHAVDVEDACIGVAGVEADD